MPSCFVWHHYQIHIQEILMQALTLALITAVTFILAACGGDGTNPASGGSNATTFQSVASAGELVSYSVDTTALTYSYEIIESAYGKTGVTGSGQLTRNSDGTYTPSEFSGKIAILDSGLLLGAIHEDLNNDGSREVVPVIGVTNPVTTLVEAAGIYNFVSRQCGGASCYNYYGTVKVNTDGSWTSCVAANLAASNYSCQGSASGSVTNLTSGRGTLIYNGVAAGSMLIFKDATNGQKVVLLDLNGATSMGKGAIFAATQSLPASADGPWSYVHTNGTVGSVNVTGTNFTDAGRTGNGIPYSGTGSFTRDVPWTGFIQTTSGAKIITAGSGLYAAYFYQTGSMSIGVKK
jgi:hypothetical protein